MNTALLLCGGVGSRLQSDIPKQYIEVSGKMIVSYALEALAKTALIDAIHIVAEFEWRERIIADAQKHGICTDKIVDFAVPGSSRQASIFNGLQNILCSKSEIADMEKAGSDDTVMIHDAVRPLLFQKQIEKCFAMLCGHDGVIPVLPMKDTVYFSDNGKTITDLMEREKIYAGQAPEVFNLRKYYQANLELMPDRLEKINGSTEPAIIAGMDIAMIDGDENNFKITTNADLERFKEIVKHHKEWK